MARDTQDVSYQVFVSYAREDAALCENIYQVLDSRFGLDVYRDLNRAYAGAYPAQIEEALLSEPRPALIVLASKSAAQSKWVRREIATYVKNTSPQDAQILVLQLTSGAMESLDLGHYQMIDLTESGRTLTKTYIDQLWLALHGRHTLDRRQQARGEAERWCEQVLGQLSVDFWGDSWCYHMQYVNSQTPQSSVITAKGGSGKSVIVAHFLEDLLRRDPHCLPVLIKEPQALGTGEVLDTICHVVGAWSSGVLIEHVERLHLSGTHVYFIIDGLDRIGRTPRVHQEFLHALNTLSKTGRLLVTSRPEIWEDDFGGLSIRRVQLDELPEGTVRAVIKKNTDLGAFFLPILCIPFYLDALLQVEHRLVDRPRSQTDILAELWYYYESPGGTTIPRQSNAADVLKIISQLQIDLMTYVVPLQAVIEAIHRTAANSSDLDDLQQRRIVMVSRLGDSTGLRLRHDLLDCFGMARILLEQEGGDRRRKEIYKRSAEDVGWQLMSSLVQYANDREEPNLLLEVFVSLLEALDRKSLGKSELPRAWAATYVLQDKFLILLPLVLDCLAGEKVDSITEAAQEPRSHVEADAKITRETASSLASAFSVIDDWRAAHPDRAIPILSANLDPHRWPKYRRRFVEALGKYYRADAALALEQLANAELVSGGDIELLGDTAATLGNVGEASRVLPTLARIIEFARNLSDTEGLGASAASIRIAAARTLRSAITARNRKAVRHDAVPAVSEEEILEDLKPYRPDGTYTDWQWIQQGAQQARVQIQTGDFTIQLVKGLIDALAHDHSYARASVAECLASIDRADVREALLAELLQTDVAAEVRRACVAALRSHLELSQSRFVRAARRSLVLRTARSAAAAFAETITAELVALGSDPALTDGLIADAEAFEVLETSQMPLCIRSIFCNHRASAVALDLIAARDRRSVGVGWENKYRLCAWQLVDENLLEVEFAVTSWSEGAGFHKAMRRRIDSEPERVDDLTERWLTGELRLPGLGSVHGILVTSDKLVVLAKRGTKTPYAPGRWSASFEEQLTDGDFSDDDDALLVAAKRGAAEEFGSGFTVIDANVLGVVAELSIANASVVVVLEVEETFAEVELSWQSLTERGKAENSAIRGLVLSDLEMTAVGSYHEVIDRHPTSGIRLRMLERWIERTDLA